jgi:hypothetical protein
MFFSALIVLVTHVSHRLYNTYICSQYIYGLPPAALSALAKVFEQVNLGENL